LEHLFRTLTRLDEKSSPIQQLDNFRPMNTASGAAPAIGNPTHGLGSGCQLDEPQ
jgi:hypothetical protein